MLCFFTRVLVTIDLHRPLLNVRYHELFDLILGTSLISLSYVWTWFNGFMWQDYISDA